MILNNLIINKIILHLTYNLFLIVELLLSSFLSEIESIDVTLFNFVKRLDFLSTERLL